VATFCRSFGAVISPDQREMIQPSGNAEIAGKTRQLPSPSPSTLVPQSGNSRAEATRLQGETAL